MVPAPPNVIIDKVCSVVISTTIAQVYLIEVSPLLGAVIYDAVCASKLYCSVQLVKDRAGATTTTAPPTILYCT